MSRVIQSVVGKRNVNNEAWEITRGYDEDIEKDLKKGDFLGATKSFIELLRDRKEVGFPVEGGELSGYRKTFEEASQRVAHQQEVAAHKQKVSSYLEPARKSAQDGRIKQVLESIANYRKVAAKEGVPVLKDQIREVQQVAYGRGAEILLANVRDQMNRLSDTNLSSSDRAKLSQSVLKGIRQAQTYAHKSGYVNIPNADVAEARNIVASYGTPGARLINRLGSYRDKLEIGIQKTAGYFKRK